jgi:hypothetical protein
LQYYTNTHHSFLQAGAAKVYITSRKASACDAAVKALNALPNLAPGAKAISVPADSAKFEGVQHLLSEVSKTTDHVDVLFANAGATWGEKFDTHPDEAFAKVMDLNVKSVFNTIRLWVLFHSGVETWKMDMLVELIGGLGLPRYCRRTLRLMIHRESLSQRLLRVLGLVHWATMLHSGTQLRKQQLSTSPRIWRWNWVQGILE